jgi:Family of unknown function (DUF6006)
MKTKRRLSWRATLCSAALIAGMSGPTYASLTVSGWWDGSWNCNIDGRPARMKWRVVDATTTNCDGEVCSTVAGSRYKGSFSDNGSAWVPLTNASRGSKGGLFFHHADGNKWFLAQPSGGKANGWTTWNGTRFPLSCWR